MTTLTLESQWPSTLRAEIVVPHSVGDSLLVFNVLDGALESARVNARALAPSGDWIQVQANGNWKLDVRLHFQAPDDAIIYCDYTSVLKADENISGSDMYFRSAPHFQTSVPQYA